MLSAACAGIVATAATALEQIGQRGKMRGRRTHPSSQAQRRQALIGNPDKTAGRHQKVLAGDELLQTDLLLPGRQACRVDQTRIAAFAQDLTAEHALGKTTGGDRQVDAALHQCPRDDLAVGLAEDQPQFRCAAGNFLDQAPTVSDFEIIREADRHRATVVLLGRRVDHRQALPAFVQRFADHRFQLIGLERRRQTASGAHEQLIAIDLTQTP